MTQALAIIAVATSLVTLATAILGFLRLLKATGDLHVKVNGNIASLIEHAKTLASLLGAAGVTVPSSVKKDLDALPDDRDKLGKHP